MRARASTSAASWLSSRCPSRARASPSVFPRPGPRGPRRLIRGAPRRKGNGRGARAGRTSARPLRLLVVDDHEVVRQGLVALLDRREEFQVVRGSGHGRRGDRERPTCPARPRDHGRPAARRIRRRGVPRDPRRAPGTPASSSSPATPTRTRCSRRSWPAPAATCSSRSARGTWWSALETVGRGDSLLDPRVTRAVLERVRRIAERRLHRRAGAADSAGAEDPGAGGRGQDQQGDRREGFVRQDGQELRDVDPVEAQPPAPRSGGGVRRQASHPGQLNAYAAIRSYSASRGRSGTRSRRR